MSNSRKIISIALIVVGLLILLTVFGSINNKKSDVFIGTVKSVNSDSVLIFGATGDEVKVAKNLYDYTVKVDKDTKIIKTSFVKPKGGEMFEVAKLPKEISDVDFATMKKDSDNVVLGIEVKLKRNLFGMVQNSALEIKYIGPKY